MSPIPVRQLNTYLLCSTSAPTIAACLAAIELQSMFLSMEQAKNEMGIPA